MDLWVREARLFKYGSGTGTNFSKLRGEGEPLSGGGSSSGLMSFLKVGDRAAGAIKSGGTTRRAAKMVCLDLDHPDIENFINWKADEEKKVSALIAAGYSSRLQRRGLRHRLRPELEQLRPHPERLHRRAFDDDSDWNLTRRTDGPVHKTVKARDLWKQVAEAAWQCADPGVQYDTTINDWHTCPESGRINASNPCSEYMFLDNTACNLASLNLMKFVDDESGEFDVEAYQHAVRLWTVVLEISVLMAQFPSKEIARLSYDYRTLGLGYANLGTVLMLLGLPYDSDEARAFTSAMTAIMTGESYATSAEMARLSRSLPRVREERAAHAACHPQPPSRRLQRCRPDEYESLTVLPMGLDADLAPAELLTAAQEPGTGRSRSASSTATAMPRRRCWRRPAPSAC